VSFVRELNVGGRDDNEFDPILRDTRFRNTLNSSGMEERETPMMLRMLRVLKKAKVPEAIDGI